MDHKGRAEEEVTGIYLPQPAPSPPPSYDLVVKIKDKEEELSLEKASAGDVKEEKITIEDEDLPSYDAAMKLGAQGYL
ncbi:UNVERIFIED_CONTAM: hypothetical protein PYX00_000816 [Menopon gallinae]|uniref:Uncharacterized protein n=1 Tax=Menopon gallinae TaxID=328185 RepID=A0AAW2IAK4_9NEOP